MERTSCAKKRLAHTRRGDGFVSDLGLRTSNFRSIEAHVCAPTARTVQSRRAPTRRIQNEESGSVGGASVRRFRRAHDLVSGRSQSGRYNVLPEILRVLSGGTVLTVVPKRNQRDGQGQKGNGARADLHQARRQERGPGHRDHRIGIGHIPTAGLVPPDHAAIGVFLPRLEGGTDNTDKR